MIPQQITLYNFLSYGATPQTISFEGYGLICLSGRNGHGKSALLDAMTWALWGQARKTTGTSKPDEGLLRLGARSMMVLFEFYIGQRLYRVRREFTLRQGNKPHLTLDVAVYDSAVEQYHSLTDKTIRQTQAVINRIVGLEYDTYVNSAYLRQGNANEFSQKAPKDRKKILTAILGIDKYDVLQTRALERARDYASQIEILKELIAHDEAELENYPVLVVQEEVIVESFSEVEAALADADKKLKNAHIVAAQYAADVKEHRVRSEALQVERVQLEAERRAWVERARIYRNESAVARQRPRLGDVQQLLMHLRQQEQMLRTQQKELLLLQQKKIAVEKELFLREQALSQHISAAKQALTVRVDAARSARDKAHDYEKQLFEQKEQILLEQASLQEALDKSTADIAERTQESAVFDTVRARFDKRKTFYNTYVPRLRWLQEQQSDREQKVCMVANESPSCPLCEQMLTAKRKHFLHEKLHKELLILRHQSNRLQGVLERLKVALIADHTVIKNSESITALLQGLHGQQEGLLARQAHVQVRLMGLHEALGRAATELVQLNSLLTASIHEHDEYQARSIVMIEQDSELVRLKAAVFEVDHAMDHVGYAADVHAALEQKIAELTLHAVDSDAGEERRAALVGMRATLTAQRMHLKEVARHVAEKEALLGRSIPDAISGEQATSAVAQVEQEIAQLVQHKQALATRQGHLAAQRMRLEEQKKKMLARMEEVALLDARYYDCTVLAQAWSKNGIQALLIEQAIPEIEHEANELLSRLSNNQAHVFIESLRDLKRGGARETLDIKIADVMGVRPYEMFSGGEAFRIDFALRIAISKLLAKRAGATLQVLIIDEGFGSQDEEGLARLMQALYAVQDDFAKIIVVTHLPAFKENFPVHFIVEKGASGSVVSVEQRG